MKRLVVLVCICLGGGASGANCVVTSHALKWSETAKRAHLSAPALQNTTKIPREDPQRGKKRTNFAAGEGKKSAKFWAVQGKGGPGKGGPGRVVPGRAVPGRRFSGRAVLGRAVPGAPNMTKPKP